MIAGLCVWQGAQAQAVPDDAVVLRVGNFALTKAEYEKLVIGFDRSSGATATGATPDSKQSAADVAKLLALVSEAQRRKVDQDPVIAARIRVRGYTLLANALLVELIKDMKKDEAGTRVYFASDNNRYVEVRVRQILVRYKGVKADKPTMKGLTRTEEQAKALAESLHAKLKQGADFAALAKASSDDETTSAKGGDLNYFMRGAVSAKFEEMSFKLPKGGLSEPFKTEHGYHVIEVLDRQPIPFEKVRAALEDIRARDKFAEIGATGVQLNEAYFK